MPNEKTIEPNDESQKGIVEKFPELVQATTAIPLNIEKVFDEQKIGQIFGKPAVLRIIGKMIQSAGFSLHIRINVNQRIKNEQYSQQSNDQYGH